MDVERIMLALLSLAVLDRYSFYADGTNDPEAYFISTNKTDWTSAKVACEEMSMRLAIIETECEQEFLEDLIGDMYHWIGMTCTSSTNCSWINDCPVEGYTNWHPNEPQNLECVWTGYGNNQWDDHYCYVQRYYICECLDH